MMYMAPGSKINAGLSRGEIGAIEDGADVGSQQETTLASARLATLAFTPSAPERAFRS